MAECFWPGVTASDLQALDERAARSAAQVSRAHHQVRYLGSILLREDEVVLCVFEGSAEAARDVAVRAGIPFNRILDASWSQRPLAPQTDKERLF